MTNLAKSLHTITVYERLIAYFIGIGYQPEDAAAFTAQVLQHYKMSDTFGLVNKALVKAQANHRKDKA